MMRTIVALTKPARDSIMRLVRRVTRSQTAFTLAELLVVVGIVVGLAAVILPNVGRFTNKGTEGALAQELSSIQTATDAWSADGNLPVPAALGWTNAFLDGLGNSNGVNLTGYLRLQNGATLTADTYCWDGYGTMKQLSTQGGACPF